MEGGSKRGIERKEGMEGYRDRDSEGESGLGEHGGRGRHRQPVVCRALALVCA
jgi:hypothetical protein